ncbi:MULTISPECIES: hypothetical protein [Pelosinus]|uniref:hypothetical protein n=1 Tax=Pelosinus TaxID=365348 RepID=UPI0002685C67|nr:MULTISPECIES: hypothetical protein [Pelosinus]
MLSAEEGEAAFFVAAGGGLVVLLSAGVFTAADLSALIELDAGGDEGTSAALFSEDLGFTLGGVGGVGLVGGVGVCIAKKLLSHSYLTLLYQISPELVHH